eukprot:1966789-Prymnesium_polylepis.2
MQGGVFYGTTVSKSMMRQRRMRGLSSTVLESSHTWNGDTQLKPSPVELEGRVFLGRRGVTFYHIRYEKQV